MPWSDPAPSARFRAAFVLSCTLAITLGAQNARPGPANVWAAQTDAKTITLVWAPLAGAVRYRLYLGTGPDAKLLTGVPITGERYVTRIGEYGSEHRYAIEAIFGDGTVSDRTMFNAVTPQAPVPGPVAAPASVQAKVSADGPNWVTWDAVPGATAYRIGRRIAPGGLRVVCHLCSTSTTFVDFSPTPGAEHVYTVSTVTPAGASRATQSNAVVASGTVATPERSVTTSGVAPADPPKGTITVPPVRGACLAIGEQGNAIVRVGDGTVQMFERVRFERGMRLVDKPSFQRVEGIANAVAVKTSGRHSLVLLGDGTLRAFGRNDRGQVGAGEGRDAAQPVAVRGITNAVNIAVGEDYSVALLADGTIRMWGAANGGQAGDGRDDIKINRTVPATIAGITNAKGITAGVGATFAVLADGTVRGWGRNFGGFGFYGVLGTGETGISSATPRPVIGVSNAVAVSTSGVSTLALLADGRVMSWGAARNLRRDQDSDFRHTAKALPVPGIRNAVAVSPYLILLADGTVRELFDPETPVAGIANAVAVMSDPTNKYALLADGRLVGWGLKQFWPKGMVTVAEFGAQTATDCAPR